MTSILTDRRERSRFLRFAVVGAIGAVVDFGVMNLLRNLFHTALVVAGTVSFICAILSNFTWNRFWTYPDSRSKQLWRQLTQFSIVSIIGLGIREPILIFLEPPLRKLVTNLGFQLPYLKPEVLSDNITLAFAVVVVMFWNFFVNRYWTYNDID